MVSKAKKVADIFASGGVKVGVVNARFVKPLDAELLLKDADSNKLIVTLEDHAASGGFGSAIAETLSSNNKKCALQIIGWPDKFIPHGTNVKILREQNGLGTAQIAARIADNAKSLGIKLS